MWPKDSQKKKRDRSRGERKGKGRDGKVLGNKGEEEGKFKGKRKMRGDGKVKERGGEKKRKIVER